MGAVSRSTKYFMTDKRLTNITAGGTKTWVATEDGKHYRGAEQDIDAIVKHVKYMDAKMNGASKKDNPNGWRYVASIPKTVLWDWLLANHYTMPQYAINEDKCKDKFLKHLESRGYSKLRAGG